MNREAKRLKTLFIPSIWEVLIAIKDNPGITTNGIVRLIDMAQANVSASTIELIKLGAITKKRKGKNTLHFLDKKGVKKLFSEVLNEII